MIALYRTRSPFATLASADDENTCLNDQGAGTLTTPRRIVDAALLGIVDRPPLNAPYDLR
jgi:hypothetical protein